MKTTIKRRLLFCIVIIIVLALAAAMGLFMSRALIDIRKEDAEHILQFYNDNIMLRLQKDMNEAASLAQTAYAMDGADAAWFEKAAAPLLEREEVRYICLVEGDTVTSALPKDAYGGQVGNSLKDFSYIYTLAKVVKESVVEGPVSLEGDASGQQVFLFLEPIVENDAYLGEVIVALDRDYVLRQLGLDYLSEQGYDYELWRVDPQNGGKEIIAVSRPDADFSGAAKTSFYLPTQWTLSIQPSTGWISPSQLLGIALICLLIAVLALALAYSLYKLFYCNRTVKQLASQDSRTGLYNETGFTAELNRWLSEEKDSVILFYFVFEGYSRLAQIVGYSEESAFLQSIPRRLQDFIKKPFIAGRIGDGNFILAVREDMNEIQQEDFAKGLSIELLMKIRSGNKKSFLTARYQYKRCRMGEGRAEEEIASLVRAYYAKRSQESPARMLTEKCRQLIEGKTDVAFDEYTDPEMTELSKTFNQYRKQVEQLAYFDPVFSIGNRPKYLRDAHMLISYDKKRKFQLFCIDICSFSQYNELFSADVGDAILQETIRRLSRLFGNYLYRINGDVFLGISLSGEKGKAFAARLQDLLAEPVSAGNASFTLQARIAVCGYPSDGDSPELLLDKIQSALRYAKELNQKTVIYDATLDQMIGAEADILHRLKSAIADGTLEVWYQPMVHVESGRFTSAEALVRLPDGKGGFFPAGQVIALAERGGLVEELGDYVLERACRFMAAHGRELGLEHMGVNLSVQQLLVENSADHLLKVIQASGVPANRITLEITESILIQSIEQVSSVLDQLRQTGLRIALDDFGVGYSSLNYLSNLPVDVIKIDRSLTRQINTNPKQKALLHSIVEMAEINSLTVVSEGVETREEQELVSAAGGQYIQGFYYARPMPPDQLIEFLAGQKDKTE